MPNKRVRFNATSPKHSEFKTNPRKAVDDIVKRHGGSLLELWFDVDGKQGHALVGGNVDEEGLVRDLDAVEVVLVLVPDELARRTG